MVIMLMVVIWPIGARLLYVGRKRRIGTEPHCRKCDYLLHGISSGRWSR